MNCKYFCTGTSREGEKRSHSSTAVIICFETQQILYCVPSTLNSTLVYGMDEWDQNRVHEYNNSIQHVLINNKFCIVLQCNEYNLPVFSTIKLQ